MTAPTIDAPASASSTERPMIYAAMAAVMADITPVGKDSRNKEQGYNFRSIEGVMNATKAALSKHSVFYLPTVLTRLTEQRTTAGGKPMNVVHLEIRYDFYAADGSSVPAIVWGEGADLADKSTNKAMSAALKYNLVQAFNIAAEDLLEDSDRSAEEAGGHQRDESWRDQPPVNRKQSNGNGNGQRANGNGHHSNGNGQRPNGQQQRPAAPAAPPPLADGDEWKDRITDVATSDEANLLFSEIVEMHGAGTIDHDRRRLLEAHLRWHMAHRAASTQPDQPAAPAPQAPAEPAPPASNGVDPVLTGEADPWANDPPDTPDPWGSEPQAPAAERPAPAAPAASGEDQDWITATRKILAEAQHGDALAGIQQQIGAKIASKAISPKTGGELSKELRTARNRIAQMAGATQ